MYLVDNVVITGGGPIGLYLAIRFSQILKRFDQPISVTVVEPKFDNYDRPGIVARNVLELISRHVKLNSDLMPGGDDSGSSHFIMGFEKALYQEAKKYNIKFVKAKVVNIMEGKLELSTGVLLDCGMAVDCTGSRRELIKIVNAKFPSDKNPFIITQFANNPIKNHFIAYVTMDAENAKLMTNKTSKNPLKHTLGLEKLRSEFGWSEFLEPELSIRKYTPEARDQTKVRTRFYLYYEIPPQLARSERSTHVAYLKELLKLKTENDVIEFEIEPGRMSFTPFEVNPQEVRPAVFAGDSKTPLIIPAGDAQIDPDYRLGMGIRSGVLRADALIGAIKSEQPGLFIDPDLYDVLLQETLGWHKTSLVQEYNLKQGDLYSSLEKKRVRYSEVLSLTDDIEGEQAIIRQGLEEINFRIAIKHHQDGLRAYHLATDGISHDQSIKTIKINKLNEVIELSALSKAESSLRAALTSIPDSRTDTRSRIKTDLLDLTSSYKNLAGTLYLSHKYAGAKKYYTAAIELLTTCFKGEQLDVLAKNYSNLAITAKLLKQYDMANHWADQGLVVIEDIRSSSTRIAPLDSDAIYAKLKFNKCSAMLDDLIQNHSEVTHPNSILLSKLKQARDLYQQIMQEKLVHGADALNLKAKFDAVEAFSSDVLTRKP